MLMQRMRTTMVLVNCSNHPSKDWDESQRSFFDVILDVPFPHVDPYLDAFDYGFRDIVHFLKNRILRAFNEATSMPCVWNPQKFLYLAGEYSVCYELILRKKEFFPDVVLAVPTTRRVVEEEVLENGEVRKVSKFRFVKWRFIVEDE